jgi:hypothetical protein
MVLAAVVARASMEARLGDLPNPESTPDSTLAWLHGAGIAKELELHERDLLRAPLGRLPPQLVIDAAWRGEGLAVLAWALNRYELPPYDEPLAFPPVPAQDAVGFGAPDLARQILASATLRPSAEIDRFASHVTVVGWRLRQFGLVPTPMDYVDYLRRHGTFKEVWLEGLQFANNDLAIRGRAVADAPADEVAHCRSAADERRRAAYWLQGDDPVYSNVDPATILSAC